MYVKGESGRKWDAYSLFDVQNNKKKISSIYGDGFIADSTVYKRFAMLRSGNLDQEHQEGSNSHWW